MPTLATRQNAPAAVQPLLNAFPLPNGPDLGNGTAGFSASYSDPSTLDSSGIRIDYLPWQRVTIFGRYSDAPSSLDQRGRRLCNYSNVSHINYRTQSLTLGSNQTLTPGWTNEFRFNYSRSRAHSFATLDNFGGAVPPPDSVLYPSGRFSAELQLSFLAGSSDLNSLPGKLGDNLQQQINVTDNVSRIIGAHQIKFGLDYRRLNPEAGLVPYQVQYLFLSLSNVLANTVPEAFMFRGLPMCNWSSPTGACSPRTHGRPRAH